MPIQSRSLFASNLAMQPVMAAKIVENQDTPEDTPQPTPAVNVAPEALHAAMLTQPVFAQVTDAGMVLRPVRHVAVGGTVRQPVRPNIHTRVRLGPRIVIRPPMVDVVLNAPQPRDKITVPISPTGDFNDQTVFEDAANLAVKYALPKYAVAEVTIEGQKRYRMAMEKIDNDAWKLTVYIVQQPTQSNLPILEHTVSAELKFGQTIAKSLPLTLEKENDTTWKTTLLLPETVDRDEVYHALTDAESKTALVLHRWVQVAVPVPADPAALVLQHLYKVERRNLDMNLRPEPFVFDPQLHPYIFAQVVNVSTTKAGYILRTAAWQGRIHHYLQDELRPYMFFYLPDSYKVTRKPEVPHTPNMLVRFSSADGTRENVRVTIEYVAAPVIDLERLKAAEEALKAFLPSPLPANISEPVFQPLVVSSIDQLELQLALPRADTSGAPLQKRPTGVVTNLTDEFSDEIADLTLEQFQTVFDAMFGESAVVFQGSLLVKGGGVMPDESVPFSARFQELAGQLFEEIEEPGPDGSILVRLLNRAESPVELRSLPVKILCDQQLIDAHVGKLSTLSDASTLPVRMAAGEEIRLQVVPDQPVNAASQRDAILDLDDVVVLPDNNTVWSAILDTSVPAEYTRTISVNVFAEWFAPPNDLIAIGVDFENGDHLILNKEKSEGQAKVRTSLEDYILRKVQEPEYRYTLIKVHTNGQQTRKVLTDNIDLLIPDINA